MIVAGCEHRPGVHCGTTALADALRVRGVELSEPMALGLGAGLGFYYLVAPGLSPSHSILGRTPRLEETACGFCVGTSLSPAWGAVALRASHRTFEGRSGTKNAHVYLVSCETAAFSAIKVKITDPRKSGLKCPAVKMPGNASEVSKRARAQTNAPTAGRSIA